MADKIIEVVEMGVGESEEIGRVLSGAITNLDARIALETLADLLVATHGVCALS